MHHPLDDMAAWIVDAGLAGMDEATLLHGFCERLLHAGLPLSRGIIGIDTLDPVLAARVFTWRRGGATTRTVDWTRSDAARNPSKWEESPFARLLETGDTSLRRRLDRPVGDAEFPVLADFRREGATDYVALLHRFGTTGSIADMDCTFSSFVTDAPSGFADADVAALERVVPALALALKSATTARIAESLVATYLGRDAGRRVLAGRILRGVADHIGAALWFSDLRDYTRISDTSPPEQLVPLLNDYAEEVVGALDAHGGEVLKFMGDGILALFTGDDVAERCGRALDAATDTHRRIRSLNVERRASGMPVTELYLGLHVGDVFYGNIGSVARLDFTVVGPAVNEVSRIAALCRSVDQPVLVSSAFAQAAGADRTRLVSVGRYALRGIHQPQELYTVDPTAT